MDDLLFDAFDELDRAAQRVLTAMPSEMTKAAEELDSARRKMRALINNHMMRQSRGVTLFAALSKASGKGE